MNRRVPEHVFPWLLFPRSLMELAASVGIVVVASFAIAIVYGIGLL